jgi:hypothetical protein
LPLAEDQYEDIVSRAKRQRAEAIGAMWRAFRARLAEFTRDVRDLAGSSNHGRLRRQDY